ncbi:KIAA1244 (predicted) [Pycnogonum litorale]
MEQVLEHIIKDSSPSKHPVLRVTCKETLDFLGQQGFLRASPSELREKCIEVMKLALETKNNKLVSHALTGFQKMLRDNSFNSVEFEKGRCVDEDKTLPHQVLSAVCCLSQLPDDVQIELLKLLLNIALTNNWSLTRKTVVWTVQSCIDTYMNGSVQVKNASQATATQTLSSYTSYLQEELKKENADENSTDMWTEESLNGLFAEVIPILNELCGKLSKKNRNCGIRRPTLLILECILAILRSLNISDVNSCVSFTNFIWQELCPSLIATLGSPLFDKNIVSSQTHKQGTRIHTVNEELGRGSACLSSTPAFHSRSAKSIYCITLELVKLVASVNPLRPVLESVFHRMLLYPPPNQRLEVLRTFREMLRKPDRLLNLILPLDVEPNKNNKYDDLSLLRLFMESANECCHPETSAVCFMSIDCVINMLSSLEELCLGKYLTSKQTLLINRMFPELENADYKSSVKANLCTKDDDMNEDSTSNRGYDAQDEFSSDGSDIQSIRKRYSKTLSDIRAYDTSDEENDGCDEESSSDTYQVEAVIHEEHSAVLTDENDDFVAKEMQADKGYSSESSGLTEGPEEGLDDEFDKVDAELQEQDRKLAEQESLRLNKVPKTLLGEDSGKSERDRVEQLCQTRNEFAEKEKQNAEHFVNTLRSLLPSMLSIKSSISVDTALQEFASDYCDAINNKTTDVKESDSDSSDSLFNITIMNADGVYLATYSALLLNLKLLRLGYYTDETKVVPLTEEQFIDEVHGSGVLVYLSAVWLSKVYQLILSENLLQNAGYNPVSMDNSALINLLTGLGFGIRHDVIILSDIDGLGNSNQGDQLLSDYQRLEKATTNIHKPSYVEAGEKLARRVLTACWDNILNILSVLLNSKSSSGVATSFSLMLGAECAKEDQKNMQEAVASSLDGLQKAARLCNILGLQSRCSAVFSQLAWASCLTDNSSANMSPSVVSKYIKKSSMLSVVNKNKSLRLHSSHVLSMDVILGRGLELSSHSPDGWKHVFRCCVYVAELEHKFFSKNQSNVPKVPPEVKKVDRSVADDLTFSLGVNGFDDNNCDNNFPVMPTSMMSSNVKVVDIVNGAGLSGSSGMLNCDQVAKVLCCLSQHIDRLYENAANKLNLSALISFLAELCAASQSQLFSQMGCTTNSLQSFFGLGPPSCRDRQENMLLLYRLSEVMLKCVRSGRPLIHIMKAWSVVAPHFVEAACHKDRIICKKAVESIHDIVNALLAAQMELPHFHFNEALFKPFENLLTLELCDADIQDQIVSSICEFVEGCTIDIKSGWRPLFGALRAVHIPVTNLTAPPLVSRNKGNEVEVKDDASHVRAVLDVFEAFLHTDNVLVFANAAVDCIMCLLKHVRGPPEMQDNNDEMVVTSDGQYLDMCVSALNYLYQCSSILASMYNMPACPVFHAANRINVDMIPYFVDTVLPNMEFVYFDNQAREPHIIHLMKESVKPSNTVTLASLDNHSNICHVWFLLLEGLAGAVATCPRKYQSHTMETLFLLLKEILEVPGPEFGVYCVNHLLLPMLQGWIRRTSRIYRGWDNFASNFKQCCGLATDLVVHYVTKLSDSIDKVCGVQLMLRQLFTIMNECIAQPIEAISRLGCACIRHAVFSLGSVMNEELWTVTCDCLEQAVKITLHSIKQLMVCFDLDSDNFYGDVGHVKVAARRDCLVSESERLRQLAHQVFLLDNQCAANGVIIDAMDRSIDEEDRSFIFLIHPPDIENRENPELSIIRVPFKNVVVSLLSHQLILQTIGTVLLQRTKYIIPVLANILLSTSNDTCCDGATLPGMTSRLNSEHLNTLLKCLESSYRAACNFDSRPGLKFLIQKVADTKVAANLYKQAGAAWTIQMVVLFELCVGGRAIDADRLSIDAVKELLNKELEKGNRRNAVSYAGEGAADYEKFIAGLNYVVRLQQHLVSFFDDYVDLVLDKDGRLHNADSITDQPIFFLLAPVQDDFPSCGKCPDPSVNFVDRDGGEDDTESMPITEQRMQSPEGTEEGKIYSVATEKTIQDLMQEYKKRKQQRSMPCRDAGRTREAAKKQQQHPSDDRYIEPVPEEIDNQRRNSIMKDGEARLEVFTEMIVSVLELLQQLDDRRFQAFLPVVFPCVSTMVTYGIEPKLRMALTDWLARVATLYQFSMPDCSYAGYSFTK